MAFALSDNIRSLRKSRGLTQEQLAEALGVTAGAVYKWEARLSLPELPMLVQMADFFDTSVDALIGYMIKDNRRDATLARLMDLRHAKDLRGIDEAEKAVMRYPNCFDVVYQSARMMHVFALEQDDKALETLKANNPMGMNNAMIGMWAIIHCDRAEEAENYLSRALLENMSRLFSVAMGYINLYDRQKRWGEAKELVRWMLAVVEGLVQPGQNSWMVKSCAVLEACLAVAEHGAGDDAAARRALEAAKAWAKRFDDDPRYDVDGVRFVKMDERATSYDDMGETAMEAIEEIAIEQEDERMKALWQEVKAE